MKSSKQRHIHRQLAVSVFSAALLIAALTAALFFAIELKRANLRAEVMLNQLLDTVENTAAIAAYSGNREVGADVLRGLLRNDIVHGATLRSDQGLTLRQARDEEFPAAGEVVRALRSPFGQGESIGTLSVRGSERVILHEARHSALVGALNSTAVIAITALILLFTVRASLSRPLLKVSNTLHAIRAGRQARLEPLSGHGLDELGQLVDDINGLLDTVEGNFAEERRLHREIQAVERQLRNIFETTSAGIFVLDGEGRLRTANPTLGRVLVLPARAPKALKGWDFPALAFADPAQFRDLMRQAEERRQAVAMDLALKPRESGEAAGWVHCLLSRQTDPDGGVHFEGVVYDITERRALELQAKHEADHDLLTGLYRRQAAERELARLLAGGPGGGGPTALLLVDLDDFKRINDTHGHSAGDTVLVEVARRLKANVRPCDIAARLGGDEFMIALVNCASPERACEIARCLVADLVQPISLDSGTTDRVGASVGIAIHDARHPTLHSLFEMADRAMYEVKRRGKNGFGVAGPDGRVVVERVAG